jgi:phosphotransferase system HPr (HPr) family protein
MPASSETGFSATVTLPGDVDLHARPAATFVKAALGFSADVEVATAERSANAKSLLTVLSLGARRGTELRLRADGDDAAEAVEALARLLATLQDD